MSLTLLVSINQSEEEQLEECMKKKCDFLIFFIYDFGLIKDQ